MNELDRMIRRAILHYPMLFTSRTAVLRHLFLVLGNGFGWLDGRLVGTDYPSTDEEALATFFRDVEDLKSWKGFNEEHQQKIDRRYRLERNRRQFLFDNLDDIVMHKEDTFEAMQQLNSNEMYQPWGLLYHLPTGYIHPDFVVGIKEISGLLFSAVYEANRISPSTDKQKVIDELRKIIDRFNPDYKKIVNEINEMLQ